MRPTSNSWNGNLLRFEKLKRETPHGCKTILIHWMSFVFVWHRFSSVYLCIQPILGFDIHKSGIWLKVFRRQLMDVTLCVRPKYHSPGFGMYVCVCMLMVGGLAARTYLPNNWERTHGHIHTLLPLEQSHGQGYSNLHNRNTLSDAWSFRAFHYAKHIWDRNELLLRWYFGTIPSAPPLL